MLRFSSGHMDFETGVWTQDPLPWNVMTFRDLDAESSRFSSVHGLSDWCMDTGPSSVERDDVKSLHAGSVVQLLLLIASDALVAPKFLLLCQMTVLLSSVSYQATSKIHQTHT